MKGFKGNQKTTQQVIREAGELDQRRLAQITAQKKSIGDFMAYLEQSNQVAAFLSWRNNRDIDAPLDEPETLADSAGFRS